MQIDFNFGVAPEKFWDRKSAGSHIKGTLNSCGIYFPRPPAKHVMVRT